jgi:hypothetical protein
MEEHNAQMRQRLKEERDARGGWGKVIQMRTILERRRQKVGRIGCSVWLAVEAIAWLVVAAVWAMTAYHWIWPVALLVRALIWWFVQRGKNKVRAKYEEKVPEQVREKVGRRDGGRLGGSALVWCLKPPIILVGLVVAFLLSFYLVLPAAIVGFWWLRRPGKPIKLKDGTWVLPRPFLWGVLGHPGVFFQHNAVGPGGTRLGSKFGPLGQPQINRPDQIADVTVNVGIGSWLCGAGRLIVTDTGGDVDRAWVATWTSADGVAEFVLDAVTQGG